MCFCFLLSHLRLRSLIANVGRQLLSRGIRCCYQGARCGSSCLARVPRPSVERFGVFHHVAFLLFRVATIFFSLSHICLYEQSSTPEISLLFHSTLSTLRTSGLASASVLAQCPRWIRESRYLRNASLSQYTTVRPLGRRSNLVEKLRCSLLSLVGSLC